MPELPEVEGLRRWLASLIVGRRIERLDVRDPKLWRPAEGLDADAVTGHTVISLDRHAKLLVFMLDRGLALVLHLKIAGQVAFDAPSQGRLLGGHPYPLPSADLPDSSTRFVLHMEGGATLFINDQRRFAWLRLLPADAVGSFVAEQKYGPDPLDPAFTPDLLASRLKARKGRPVKAALLDQTCVAGLGNIYVDESLHRAHIHPMARAGDLQVEDVRRLHQAIRDVLEVAVPVGGALVKVSRTVDDPEMGRDFLRVHGRAGELCPNCVPEALRTGTGTGADIGDAEEGEVTGPRIIRAFLAGRGTYFCAVCQPAPPGFVLPVDATQAGNDGGPDD